MREGSLEALEAIGAEVVSPGNAHKGCGPGVVQPNAGGRGEERGKKAGKGRGERLAGEGKASGERKRGKAAGKGHGEGKRGKEAGESGRGLCKCLEHSFNFLLASE